MHPVTAAWYQRQSTISARAAAAVQELWRQVDPARISESWTELLPQAAAAVTSAQLLAATQADTYTAAQLEQAGRTSEPSGKVNPTAFVAPTDAMASLLYLPAITAKVRIAGGMAESDALLSAAWQLVQSAQTEAVDAGRGAVQVAMTGDRSVGGYRRALRLPSCSRCIVLAGKWFRWNQGFLRHPNCFPAGVTVSGPATQAASRRWYEGELVIIRTASGQELPSTANHPVLTDQGWVPAHLLQVGDHVLRSLRPQGAVPLVVPDEQQRPTLIENVGRSLGVVTLGQVPTAAKDFHGDGGHGQVDVVLADGVLRDRIEAAFSQPPQHLALPLGVAVATALASQSASMQFIDSDDSPSRRGVSGGGLGLALALGHATCPHLPGFGHAADGHPGGLKSTADDVARYAVAEAEAVLALSGLVRRRDDFEGQADDLPPRWDAAGDPLTVEGRRAYAGRGQDLLLRLAGEVELDRVVEVSRIQWSGHVYNLTSSEGWFAANGLIVSNCDCIHVPAAEAGDLSDAMVNPQAAFDSMSKKEQDRVFGVGARAIRDGADIGQVVNARRGMADGWGSETLEGTTRRGAFYRRAAKVKGTERVGETRSRIKGGTPPRLSVREIYKRAGDDREEAVRLLTLAGYIL